MANLRVAYCSQGKYYTCKVQFNHTEKSLCLVVERNYDWIVIMANLRAAYCSQGKYMNGAIKSHPIYIHPYHIRITKRKSTF